MMATTKRISDCAPNCSNVMFISAPIELCFEKVVAHAISSDRAMSAGVAPAIRKQFMGNKNFYRPTPPASSLNTLFVYQLDGVTTIGLQSKLYKSNKPGVADMKASIHQLVMYLRSHEIDSVAMPFIYGGLDSKNITSFDTLSTLLLYPDIRFNIYLGRFNKFAPKNLCIPSNVIFSDFAMLPTFTYCHNKMVKELTPTFESSVVPTNVDVELLARTLFPIPVPPPMPIAPVPFDLPSFVTRIEDFVFDRPIPVIIPVPPPMPAPISVEPMPLFWDSIPEKRLRLSPGPQKYVPHSEPLVSVPKTRPFIDYTDPVTVAMIIGSKTMTTPAPKMVNLELLDKLQAFRESRPQLKQNIPHFRISDFILDVDAEETIKFLCNMDSIPRYAHVRRLWLYYKTTSAQAFARTLKYLMCLTWDEICQMNESPIDLDSYIHEDLRFTDSKPVFDPLNVPDDPNDPLFEAGLVDLISTFKNMTQIIIQKGVSSLSYCFELFGKFCLSFLQIPVYTADMWRSMASSTGTVDKIISDFEHKMSSFSVSFDINAMINPIVSSIKSHYNQGLLDSTILSHLMFFLSNATKHPLGIISAIFLLFRSNSMAEFLAASVILCSFFGVESLIASSILSRLFNVSYDQDTGDAFQDPVFQSNDVTPDPFKDFLISAKGWISAELWDSLKDYLVPLLAGASCLGLGGDLLSSSMNKLHSMSAEMAKFKKDIAAFEDTLADVGIFASARTKFIDDLKKSLSSLVVDIQFIEFQVNDKCSVFCNDAEYSRVLSFDRTLWNIRENIATHKYDKFITTTMTQELALVTRKFDKLRVKIDAVRSKNGTRVTPVGVIFQSPSGIGKSYMSSIFQQKLFAYLYAMYESDVNKYSMFKQAKYYTVWNVQSRDKYDTGYEGQDWHYNDDAFKESNDLDHAAYITWISNQKIGQVMSDNDEKGKDYKALGVHLCLNVYPKNSITLRNKDALDNRFPYFYQVDNPTMTKIADASNLRFYKTSTTEIHDENSFAPVNAEMKCRDFRGMPDREMTMDDVVKEVADGMYNNHIIWRNRTAAINFDDEVSKAKANLSQAGVSSGSVPPPVFNAPRWSLLTDELIISGTAVPSKDYKVTTDVVQDYDAELMVRHPVPGDGLCGYHSIAFFMQCSTKEVIDQLMSTPCIHLFGEKTQKSIISVLSSIPQSNEFWMTDDVLALAALHFGFSVVVHTGQAMACRLTNTHFSRTFHFYCADSHWSPVIVSFKHESVDDQQSKEHARYRGDSQRASGNAVNQFVTFKQEKSLVFKKDFSGYIPIRQIDDILEHFPVTRLFSIDATHPMVRDLEYNQEESFLPYFARKFPSFFQNVETFYQCLGAGGCLKLNKIQASKRSEVAKFFSSKHFVYDDRSGVVSAYFDNSCFVSVPRQYIAKVNYMSNTNFVVHMTRLDGFTGDKPNDTRRSWQRTREPDMRDYRNAGPYEYSWAYDKNTEDVSGEYNWYNPDTFFKHFGYDPILPKDSWKDRLYWSFDKVNGTLKKNFSFWFKFNCKDSSNFFVKTLASLRSIPTALYSSCMYLFSEVLCLDRNTIWLILAVLGGGIIVNTCAIFLITHLLRLLVGGVYRWWYFVYDVRDFVKFGSQLDLSIKSFTHVFLNSQNAHRYNQTMSKFIMSHLQDVKGKTAAEVEHNLLYDLVQHLLTSQIGPSFKTLSPYQTKKETLMYLAHFTGYYISQNRADIHSLVSNFLSIKFKDSAPFPYYFSDSNAIYQQRNRMPSNPKYSHYNNLVLNPSSVSTLQVAAENESLEVPVKKELLDYITQPKTTDQFRSIRKNISPLTTMGSVPTTNRTPLKMLPVAGKYATVVDQSSFEEFGYIPHFIDSSVSALKQVNIDTPYHESNIDLESFDMLKDRSSVDCLNSFRKRNIASICLNPSISATPGPNHTKFGHTFFGWLHKFGLFSPAHGLAVNDEAIVCPISPTSSDRSTYYLYRVVVVDHEADLCLWKAVAKNCASISTLSKMAPSIINNLSQPTEFPPIYKLLPLQSEVGDANQHYSGLIFSPSNNFAIPISLSYYGRVSTSTGQNCGSQDFIVNQLQNYAVTGPGDCGSPLIVLNPGSPRKLIGMHHLSQGNSVTYSIVTYRERLEALEAAAPSPLSDYYRKAIDPKFQSSDQNKTEFQSRLEWTPKLALETKYNKISNYINFEDPKLEYLGDGNIVGVGDFVDESGKRLSLDPVRFRDNNPWAVVEGPERVKQRTPFYGCFDVDRHPSVLSPLDPRVKKWTHAPTVRGQPNLLVGQTNLYQDIPSDRIDMELLENMVDQVTEHFTTAMSGREVGICNVFEALKGDKNISPNHEPMNLRSANGIPFNFLAKPSGHHLFEFEADRVNLLCKEAHLCLDMAEEKVDLANQGVRTFSIWKNCLKDELRPLAKVEDPKTRLFVAAPRDTTIAFRILFGRFKAVWTDMRDILCHSVGINVHSVEWGMLFKKLDQHEHHFDIDFAAFDKRQLRAFIIAVGYIIIESIDRISKDGFKEARWTLWMEIIDTFCISYDTVFMKKNANPSGNPITTPLNCILHLLYLFYCWSKVTGICDFALFLQHVSMGIFGDDGCYGVSSEYFPKFNFHSIKSIMLDIGQVVTPGCKADDDGKTFDVATTELVFLKRRFHPFAGGDIVLAPLQKDSIEGMFTYSSVPYYDALTWKNTIMECFLEAAQHGAQYYNQFRNILRKRYALMAPVDRMHFAPLVPIFSYTYRTILGLVFERYTGCSRSFIDFSHVIDLDFEENLRITTDLSVVSGVIQRPGTVHLISPKHLPRRMMSCMRPAQWEALLNWQRKGCPGGIEESDGQWFIACVGDDSLVDFDVLSEFLPKVSASHIFFDLQNINFSSWFDRLAFYDTLNDQTEKTFTLISPNEYIVNASRKELARFSHFLVGWNGSDLDLIFSPEPTKIHDGFGKLKRPQKLELFNRSTFVTEASKHVSEVLQAFYVLQNPGKGLCAWYVLGYWLAQKGVYSYRTVDDLRSFVADKLRLNDSPVAQEILEKCSLTPDLSADNVFEQLVMNTLTLLDLEYLFRLFKIKYTIVCQSPVDQITRLLGNSSVKNSCVCIAADNHVMAAVPLTL